MTAAGHREIDHTADIAFELWAPSMADLFAEGILALAEVCYDRGAVQPVETRPLSATADSAEELLVRWLQDAYLLLEADLWLASAASDVSCEGTRAAGVLHGEPYDPDRHTLHTEIKAITYHRLRIRRQGDTWRTTVIVDV